MLQPSTITSPISIELTESLQQRLLPQTLSGVKIWKLRTLGLTITLPNNPRSFLLFLLGLSVVCIGMTMQIMLSIQIWQTTAKIDKLKFEYQAIERKNTAIVWEIAQKSTLERVQQRAQALGYKIVLDRYYIPAPGPIYLTQTNTHPSSTPNITPSKQPAPIAATIDTIAKTDQSAEFGFANHLYAATHALRQWWQRQWQTLLQS